MSSLCERQKLRTRYDILQAAWALWERDGMADTKLSDIADLAGVSGQTLYNHFPNKTRWRWPCSTTGRRSVWSRRGCRRSPDVHRPWPRSDGGGGGQDDRDRGHVRRHALAGLRHRRGGGGGRCLRLGRHSVHQNVLGAVNLYLASAEHLDDEVVQLAETFAGYASVAMANAHLYQATAALADEMAAAMANRAVIEQAKGILVAQRAVTPDQAFELLAQVSQNTNRKLCEIAQELVDTGHLPS